MKSSVTRRWVEAARRPGTVLIAIVIAMGWQVGGACAADVTSSVSISKSGLVYARATNTFNSVVTITNTSGATLPAPLELVVSSTSPSTVTLANATGQDGSGHPEVTLSLGASGLAPGQSASAVLGFADPSRVSFTFTLALITVTPLSLSSSVLAMSSGDSGAVAITLASPAGPNGVSIALSSSDPSVVVVPSAIFVPAGYSQGFIGLDAIGQGSAIVTATVAGVGSTQLSVNAQARDFRVVGAPTAVAAGQMSDVDIVLDAPAPPGGASFTITSTNTSALNVTTPTVSIAAGGRDATFSIEGLSSGAAHVQVSAVANASGTQSFALSVIQAAGSTTITSRNLIDQAVASGQLSPDQAIVYRILAQFGSNALPSQYQGTPARHQFADNMSALVQGYATLTPQQQAVVAPYLLPPIYSDAWVESGGPTGVSVQAASLGIRSASTSRAAVTTQAATVSPDWGKLVTQHFKIWYRTNPPADLYSAIDAAQGALNVATWAEYAYESLSGLLGRDLISDVNQERSGGDGLYDIYVVHLGNSADGISEPFPQGGCGPQASYMLVNELAALNSDLARSTVAHELMHAFQATYNRLQCAETWMSEATASWAEYYVYRPFPGRTASEHDYARQYFGEEIQGTLTGATVNPLQQEFRWPIDQSAGARVNCLDGYCDYVFFVYLSNVATDAVIPKLFSIWQNADAVHAIDGALGGTLNTVWHDYAHKMWNDWQTPTVEDDFMNKYDPPDFEYGIFHTYEQLPFAKIKVELNGAQSAEYSSEINLALDPEIVYRLSATPLYFTFEDPSVSYVAFLNPLFDQKVDQDFKIYGRAKISGQWDGSWSDWTHKDVVTWCRDKKSERIEELVVILSNGSISGGGTTGQSVQDVEPNLAVSNIGCFQWSGSASLTTTTAAGLTTTVSATGVVLQRDDTANSINNDYQQDSFTSLAQGTANLTASGSVNAACSVNEGPLQTPANLAAADATLNIHLLGLPIESFTGEVLGGGGITHLVNIPYSLVCGGMTVDSTPKSGLESWMKFPGAPSYKAVSPDGHSITGSFTEPPDGAGATTTEHWDLHAVVEP